MDLTETEIECVVSRIFESLNQKDGTISTKLVIELISAYVSQDRPEFSSLQKSIQYSAYNGNIGQSDLKFALCNWAENLKTIKGISSLGDISEYNIDSKNDYTSYSSNSSHGYREHIEELTNDITNKKHTISKLMNQIDTLSRQHEESHNMISKERDTLLKKLINEQSHNSALRNIKTDYEEAVECLQNTKKSVLILNNDLEKSKKEIERLTHNIANLNEEKQKLVQQLAHLDKEKTILINKIEEIERCNDVLQDENAKLVNDLSEQKFNTEILVQAKKSIEEELEGYIANSESRWSRYKCKDILEDSIDDELKQICKPDVATNSISLMQELSLLPESDFSCEETYGKERGTFTIDYDEERSSMILYLKEALDSKEYELQEIKQHVTLVENLFRLYEQRAREKTIEVGALRSHRIEWNSLSKCKGKTPKKNLLGLKAFIFFIFAIIFIYSMLKSFNWSVLKKGIQYEGQQPF